MTAGVAEEGTRQELVDLLHIILVQNAQEGDTDFTELDEFDYYYNQGGLSILEDKLHAILGSSVDSFIQLFFEDGPENDPEEALKQRRAKLIGVLRLFESEYQDKSESKFKDLSESVSSANASKLAEVCYKRLKELKGENEEESEGRFPEVSASSGPAALAKALMSLSSLVTVSDDMRRAAAAQRSDAFLRVFAGDLTEDEIDSGTQWVELDSFSGVNLGGAGKKKENTKALSALSYAIPSEVPAAFKNIKWSEIEYKPTATDSGEAVQDSSVLINYHSWYHMETGADYSGAVSSATSKLFFMETDKFFPFYNTYFNGIEHSNYIGVCEAAGVGPIVISIENKPTNDCVRVVIRTRRGEDRLVMSVKDMKSPMKESFRLLKAAFPDELGSVKFQRIKEESLCQELTSIESKLFSQKFKWGVLYCKNGQVDENEMFSNKTASEDFEEFLEFLGKRITLKGWKNYRGGLDVKNDATGEESIYTEFHDFEIMFHVSTLLPYHEDDAQKVERKRHLGNDIVVIIFKEGDQLYDPQTIRSEFNHVFCVVHKLNPGKKPAKYRISITVKEGVPVFFPLLPSPETVAQMDLTTLREFLLTKLVNAERSAQIYAPDFSQKLRRTRQNLYANLVKTYCS